MNETILRFIQKQTCTSICCIDDKGNPYCFSCYYTFGRNETLLYFKSSENAYHVSLLAAKPFVAGTILPDKLNKIVTRGIQWQGELLQPDHPLAKNAAAVYHENIPLALAVKGRIFTVRLDNLKMTDSQLGFGKKIYWDRQKAI